MQHRFSLLRGIFIGYGPSWAFSCGTKFFPQSGIVELQYHAVSFVGKLPALFIPLLYKVTYILQFMAQAVVRAGIKSELFELAESLELRRRIIIISFQVVSDKTHVAAGNFRGILEFERPRGCIAGIGKPVFFRTALIKLLKIHLAHKHFAAHLNLALFTLSKQAAEIRQPQRDRRDGFNICSDIVALNAIAPCCTANQNPLAIEQAYGNTIKFQLCNHILLVNTFKQKKLSDPIVKLLKIAKRVSIRKAQHWFTMLHRREYPGNGSSNPL